jgi:hypothetical protein
VLKRVSTVTRSRAEALLTSGFCHCASSCLQFLDNNYAMCPDIYSRSAVCIEDFDDLASLRPVAGYEVRNFDCGVSRVASTSTREFSHLGRSIAASSLIPRIDMKRLESPDIIMASLLYDEVYFQDGIPSGDLGYSS